MLQVEIGSVQPIQWRVWFIWVYLLLVAPDSKKRLLESFEKVSKNGNVGRDITP